MAARVIALLRATRFHDWCFPVKRCNVCRRRTLFVCVDPSDRWIRMCLRCRSSPKYRAIAWAVERAAGRTLAELARTTERGIFELSTTSGIHRVLRGRPGYVASGYFPDRPIGVEIRPAIWNADVQQLPFKSGSFDVVISSETFEHVRRPEAGFRELHRVLRPGGLHCFTVPFRSDHARSVASIRQGTRTLICCLASITSTPTALRELSYIPISGQTYRSFSWAVGS